MSAPFGGHLILDMNPATPVWMYSRTHRITLTGVPYPVSASAIIGMFTALARSGGQVDLGHGGETGVGHPQKTRDTPYPEGNHRKSRFLDSLAVTASKQPGTTKSLS